MSIHINKKHTLYALAGVTLSNLIATSTTSSTDTGDDDSQGCLAIANTLVQYEGAMLDAKTNSSTVKDCCQASTRLWCCPMCAGY